VPAAAQLLTKIGRTSKMARWTRAVAGALVLAATMTCSAAQAQFYKGKTITMIINYPAGGPSDIEGRIMAQYLPAHIPGKPTIIVKNIGGGSGLIGSNFLGEVAKPDGMSIGFFTWSPTQELLNDPGLRVKFSQFQFVAAVKNPVVYYIRTDVPPGIKTAKDFLKAKDFKAVSLGQNSSNTLSMAITLPMLGVSYKAVTGYKGLKPVETAILQNEGQMANTSLPGWLASVEPNMGKKGQVIALFQISPPENGAYPRYPSIPNIPTFEEYYESVKGKKPSGLEYEALRVMMDAQTAMFRAIFLPPKAPKEAEKVLDEAMSEMWKDKGFIDTYTKVVRSAPQLVRSAAGEAVMASLGKVKPEVTKYLADLVTKVGKK
jgi:tripartite-type tricarboxylate transporter receptor subunit TctC